MPDGTTLLFTVGSISSPNNYDNATIYAVSIDGTGRKKLVEGANMARFVAPDKLIYSRSGSLYVSRLDPNNLEVIGEPIRVREAVASDPSSGAGYFDISPDGDLLYIAGSVTQSNAKLVRIDRSGQVTELDLEPQGYANPRLSPDGTQVAFSISTGPQSLRGDIWTYSLADRSLRRISFGGTGLLPLWHPTEPKIFFADSDDSTLKSKPADGRGEAVTVLEFSAPTLPSSLSPDGESISITQIDDVTSSYIASLENGEERLVAAGSSTPAISPDGRWIAYGSPAAGLAMVYVEPIEGGGKWQISTDYASYPLWSRDGKKLFFIRISDQRAMMEVDVDLTGETFQYGMPRVLFDDLTLYSTTTAPRLNWDTDGEQFIFVKMIRDDNSLFRIEVVLDWAQQINLTQL
jgi:Tol biopolymer transport system component